jgi:hypothetical protein
MWRPDRKQTDPPSLRPIGDSATGHLPHQAARDSDPHFHSPIGAAC